MPSDLFRHSSAASVASSAKPALRPAAQPAPAQTAIFQLCLRQASENGRALMDGLLSDAVALASVQAAAPAAFAPAGRHVHATALAQAVTLLTQHAAALCLHFPEALRRTFAQTMDEAPVKDPVRSPWRADQLELMDDAQVRTQIALAHLQQNALLETDAILTELNALMSTVQGFAQVYSELNPLRPASYANALQSVFKQSGVTPVVELTWLQLITPSLGRALSETYTQALQLLKSANTQPAAYGVVPSTDMPVVSAQDVGHYAQHIGSPNVDETRQTVRRFRQILAGNPSGRAADYRVQGGAGRGFGATGMRASDKDDPSFDHTLPAALEALEDMQQVEKAMVRLAQREQPVRRAPAHGSPVDRLSNERVTDRPAPLGATQLAGMGKTEVYKGLRQQATGVGQVLGLEVVALMVENVASDARLLPPVQAVIRALEQPLLRLAMVDSRFFTNKQHPARQLLEAIVAHNARFDTVDSTAFALFIQPLRQVVDELQHVPIDGAEPFSLCLVTLTQIWEEQLAQERARQEQTINTLRRADQRNQLALHVAHDIRERTDAQGLPAAILAFATGPWAQVIAHARLAALPDGARDSISAALSRVDTHHAVGVSAAPTAFLGHAPVETTGLQDPEMALLDDLFWSVHPELAKNDPNRLVKLIPGMLGRLRTGLKTIEYPQIATNGFFDVLMVLHQKALLAKTLVTVTPPPPPDDLLDSVAPTLEQALWLAPSEAQASGFMLGDFDLPSFAPASSSLSFVRSTAVATSGHAPLDVRSLPDAANADAIPTGSWVEMLHDGRPMSAQLVWISAERTMYMFTTPTGRNQTLTRSSLDKLIHQGDVKIIQRREGLDDIFEQALDTAEQNALRETLADPGFEITRTS